MRNFFYRIQNALVRFMYGRNGTDQLNIALLGGLSLLPPLERHLKNRSDHFEIHLELSSRASLRDFVDVVRRLGLRIDDIEANPAYLSSGLSVYSVAMTVCGRELKAYKTHREIIQALGTLDYVCHVEEMD